MLADRRLLSFLFAIVFDAIGYMMNVYVRMCMDHRQCMRSKVLIDTDDVGRLFE